MFLITAIFFSRFPHVKICSGEVFFEKMVAVDPAGFCMHLMYIHSLQVR